MAVDEATTLSRIKLLLDGKPVPEPASIPLTIIQKRTNRETCRGCDQRMGRLCTKAGRPCVELADTGGCPLERFGGSGGARTARKTYPALPFVQNIDRKRSGHTPIAHPVSFPVDVVYTWVDGSDPKWLESYKTTMKGTPSQSRFTSSDELRFSLRSIERFAPWVNHIWVVTADQSPPWLNTVHPKISIVSHREIIPSKYLPTFNSNAIESNIWKIEGLAEHFIYFNDDMLFGADVQPGHFFDSDGKVLVRAGGKLNKQGVGGFAGMLANAASLLDELFGVRDWPRGWHQMIPLTRTMLKDLYNRRPNILEDASCRRTRSGKDIGWTIGAWPSFALEAGYGVRAPHGLDSAYIEANNRNRMVQASARMPHAICVNNGTGSTGALLNEWLWAYFPKKSAFETGKKWTPLVEGRERCVMTAANQGYEEMLPWWYSNLRKHSDLPVVFADWGMSSAMVGWCKERGEVVQVGAVRKGLRGPRSTYLDCIFRKPDSILRSTYRQTLWMDCDVEVRGNFSSAFDAPATAEVAAAHDDPAFAAWLGVAEHIQTGVVLARHGSEFVIQWATHLADPTFSIPRLHKMGDQMVFNWLVEKQPDAFSPLSRIFNWVCTQGENPEALMFHWAGRKNKQQIREWGRGPKYFMRQ